MTEAGRADPATLPETPVGERLRAAREALGLSLAEVAARTRVPLRHLEAIELSDFNGLPSVTYAVGFVRGYARAVGADEVALARDTRIEVASTARARPVYEPYTIADPRRVPSRGVTIVAAGLGLAVLVLGILWFATSLFRGGGDTPAAGAPVVAAMPAATQAAAPMPPRNRQVRLTANDEIWMRVYDADNETLFIGTMKPGDTFDVPLAARDPMINIGRPDKLGVTLDGVALAPLGTGERAIKDVPIGAAALAARAAGTAPDVSRPGAVPQTTAPPAPGAGRDPNALIAPGGAGPAVGAPPAR